MGSMTSEDQLFQTDPVAAAPPRARADVAVDKAFRAYDQDQSFLMPPSLRDWLPAEHLAHFVSELVDEVLDSSIETLHRRSGWAARRVVVVVAVVVVVVVQIR